MWHNLFCNKLERGRQQTGKLEKTVIKKREIYLKCLNVHLTFKVELERCVVTKVYLLIFNAILCKQPRLGYEDSGISALHFISNIKYTTFLV